MAAGVAGGLSNGRTWLNPRKGAGGFRLTTTGSMATASRYIDVISSETNSFNENFLRVASRHLAILLVHVEHVHILCQKLKSLSRYLKQAKNSQITVLGGLSIV